LVTIPCHRPRQAFYRARQALVAPVAQVEQGPNHIAPEAVYGCAWSAAHAERAALSLKVIKDMLYTPPDARITAVGSQLCEEQDLPNRAAILWRVSGSGLHPVAVGILGIEDRGRGPGCHHAGLSRSDFVTVRIPIENVAQREVPHAGVLGIGFQEPI
jgi:hypothetical protein